VRGVESGFVTSQTGLRGMNLSVQPFFGNYSITALCGCERTGEALGVYVRRLRVLWMEKQGRSRTGAHERYALRG
jgi:hypothetical protein